MTDPSDPVLRSTPGATPPSDVPTSPGAAEMRLGEWILGAEIGRGAMGVVYRARHASDGRIAAVKVLSPRLAADERFVERFERESQATMALAHPRIVAILDRGVTTGLPWYAMELVDGQNLRERMRRGRLSDEQLVRLAIGVCQGLEHAHAQGVVHRDIKPENLILEAWGEPKIADFGLALLFGDRWLEVSRLSATGAIVGTPFYVAPEILRGLPPDARSDLYSLGVVLYEALTGDLPVGRFRRLHEVRATIDPRLDDLVMHLLESSPEGRVASAKELGSDLARILTGAYVPPELLEDSTVASLSGRAKPKKIMWVIGSLVVILSGVYAYTQAPDPTTVAMVAVVIALAVALGWYGWLNDRLDRRE